MAELKARWLSLIEKYSEQNGQCVVENAPPVPTAPLEKLANTPAPVKKKLPLYEATPAQINYWHACGANIFLQQFLRDFDLDFFFNVDKYDRFKIGYDDKAHRATFAIDATHYYAIAFDTYDARPIDKRQAKLVLSKICSLC